jgi:hypothetical protein
MTEQGEFTDLEVSFHSFPRKLLPQWSKVSKVFWSNLGKKEVLMLKAMQAGIQTVVARDDVVVNVLNEVFFPVVSRGVKVSEELLLAARACYRDLILLVHLDEYPDRVPMPWELCEHPDDGNVARGTMAKNGRCGLDYDIFSAEEREVIRAGVHWGQAETRACGAVKKAVRAFISGASWYGLENFLVRDFLNLYFLPFLSEGSRAPADLKVKVNAFYKDAMAIVLGETMGEIELPRKPEGLGHQIRVIK